MGDEFRGSRFQIPDSSDTPGQTSFVIPLRTSPAATIRPLSQRHIAIFLRPRLQVAPNPPTFRANPAAPLAAVRLLSHQGCGGIPRSLSVLLLDDNAEASRQATMRRSLPVCIAEPFARRIFTVPRRPQDIAAPAKSQALLRRRNNHRIHSPFNFSAISVLITHFHLELEILAKPF